MFNVKTILHPTDFSPRSALAFDAACSLARDRGARIVLLHILEVPVLVPSGVMTAPPPPPPSESDKKAAWDRLQALKPAEGSIALEHRLEMGNVAAAILEVAKDIQPDLIVMGTHGRTGLGRLLMGSVAEKVLRSAVCPVLTMKTPG